MPPASGAPTAMAEIILQSYRKVKIFGRVADPLDRRPWVRPRAGISGDFRREGNSRIAVLVVRSSLRDGQRRPDPLHRVPRRCVEYFRLSSVWIVVPKQTTEPFSALDFPLGPAYFSPGIDDSVPESLVIAFVVKVLAELSEGSTQ